MNYLKIYIHTCWPGQGPATTKQAAMVKLQDARPTLEIKATAEHKHPDRTNSRNPGLGRSTTPFLSCNHLQQSMWINRAWSSLCPPAVQKEDAEGRQGPGSAPMGKPRGQSVN